MSPSVLEICAGAGGQALGLERAGFECAGAVEIDPHACATLRLNRPDWRVFETSVVGFDAKDFDGVDLLAGGVPCPPFSIAGKQLGQTDERDLFPEALRLVEECRPRAVLLENVPGFASAKFADYRKALFQRLARLGYTVDARVVNASDFGVSQLRPRFVLVALLPPFDGFFRWPPAGEAPSGVGYTVRDLMGAGGWPGLDRWVARACAIAPTIVGGSKKHGGPDLGPTRAKAAWEKLSVNGKGIANTAPDVEFPVDGLPKLTNRMVARLQGFPDDWRFSGGKTAVYRQIGNAFPPPVSAAVGASIHAALQQTHRAYGIERSGQMYVFEGDGKS